MISPSQIRAARALIGWRQSDLARESAVSEISIKNIERGATAPRSRTLKAIEDALERGGALCFSAGSHGSGVGAGVMLTDALEAAGFIFVAENGDGPGVRLRKNAP